MTLSPYPVLRLKPKADARAIRHGAPWVCDNEVMTDRACPAVRLEAAQGRRRKFFDAPFYRLVPAEADGLPAW